MTIIHTNNDVFLQEYTGSKLTKQQIGELRKHS